MKREDFKIEICANSVQSCIAAQIGGADRVELCAGIPEGGTTPSFGMIRMARESISIGLNVIIRPRGGDFLYSADEVKTMLYDIEMAGKAGADGLVFGVLTPDGDIDMDVLSVLMKASDGLPVTFHRAFDHTKNPLEAMHKITDAGCCRILSSGCRPTAYEGAEILNMLVREAGDSISVMPGCGINASNIPYIASVTGASEFHFSARENIGSLMSYRNPSVLMGTETDEYTLPVTTGKKVEETINALCRG